MIDWLLYDAFLDGEAVPQKQGFGLYLHLPYCRALCPYCDFAKTANFDDRLIDSYLLALATHLGDWLEVLALKEGAAPTQFTSVFIGGGTPSLVTTGYEPLFAIIRRHLALDAEITLEANPDDVNASSLKAWKDLGVNRLSMGIQTFAPEGLKVLKRIHSADDALRAIEEARAVFANVNIDLIYGWPAQTLNLWREDLEKVVASGVPHLSLYTLTYEPRTPLGRAFLRGHLPQNIGHDDDLLADFYTLACDLLGQASYQHEEVSNWSLPGFSCRHNWLYWQDAPYLAIGAGAHGYLPEQAPWGLRYAYPRNDRLFVKPLAPFGLEPDGAAMLERIGAVVEADRDQDSWLLEMIGSGLRTCRGLDLRRLEQNSKRAFAPIPIVAEALASGVLGLSSDGYLLLSPPEWFRETAWSVAVARSFGL